MKAININSFKDFFASKSVGGILLIICVAAGLIIANSSLGKSFENILKLEVGRNFGSVSLKYPVLLWINDGLMAIFFLLVGLEIKRELVEGELSTPAQAALPVFAALGGMILPALLFLLFNAKSPTSGGWGIPMATDIAFAIAILSLLGDKIPTSLKVFLTALAIVDDLGAIIVIAIFYSSDLHLDYLGYAAVVFLFLVIINRLGVMNIAFYILPGLLMWYFIHHSGIHATIAGVLTALTVPTSPDATESPLEKLEHLLNKPVNFLIMPLFALVNTNIKIDTGLLQSFSDPLGMGILTGLFIGKPLGISGLSWVSVKLRLCALPEGTRWIQLFSVSVLGGIGFTMSIFMALLSFKQPELQSEAKFVILLTSLLAGISGFVFLKRIYRN